jgi:hypothetical protein
MKAFIAALLFPIAASAQTWSAKNESGGEIIITLRQATCKQYSTASFDGYAFAKNGRMLEFCWAIVDDMIRVVYLDDQSVRIYNPGFFKQKTDK